MYDLHRPASRLHMEPKSTAAAPCVCHQLTSSTDASCSSFMIMDSLLNTPCTRSVQCDFGFMAHQMQQSLQHQL
jgi:hypothetical protein